MATLYLILRVVFLQSLCLLPSKVSFLELYNEEIFDLLSKHFDPEKKHKIFEDSAKKGSVIVQVQQLHFFLNCLPRVLPI